MTTKNKILIEVLLGFILIGNLYVFQTTVTPNKKFTDVYIRTDKNSYNSTEDVSVFIRKVPYAESYYYNIDPCCNLPADIKLEKYENGSWTETTKELKGVVCHSGPCIGCMKLKDTEFKVNFKFEPSIEYRFKLAIGTDCNNLAISGKIVNVYSNEFMITK